MRKALIVGFMFVFLFAGQVVNAQVDPAPAGTFAPFAEGPDFLGTEPELANFGANAGLFTGFPRWLRDPKTGIQLGLCTDTGVAGFPEEPPPCPGFTNIAATPTTPVDVAANYYSASVIMCGDPLECDPATAPPGGDQFILGFLVGAEPDPAGLEAAEPPGFEIVLRGANGGTPLTLQDEHTVETPFGTFGPFTPDPQDGQIEPLPQTVIADLMSLRGNGTANFPVPNFVADPEALPPVIVNVPAFPGFIGNGLVGSPLRGLGGSTFRVFGPRGSGVDVATSDVVVEGKVFTTPTATAGGLLVERGTMGGRGGKGVLFATTNDPAGIIGITQIAGAVTPTPMTLDPNTPAGAPRRFFAIFDMANLPRGAVEAGVSMSVTGGNPALATELTDIAHVMQDTVTVKTATHKNGKLSINAASSLPGSAKTPGATFTVESVLTNDPAAVGTPILGTANKGRFTADMAQAPAFVRVKSSLGGSLIVPVKTTPAGLQEIITIRRAIFNSARGTLTIQASSTNRAAALTARGISISPTGVITPLTDFGPMTKGRLTVPGVVAPPSWVEVSSAGAVMRIPVTVQ